jgi:MFS superfamily sulfate permease-like transporter
MDDFQQYRINAGNYRRSYLSIHWESFLKIGVPLVVIMFTCVIFTEFVQLLFGYLKVGKLIKILPLSVTMGIITIISMIIIVKQLPIIFNVNSGSNGETLLLIFISLSLKLF